MARGGYKLSDAQVERIRKVLKDWGVAEATYSTGATNITSWASGEICVVYRLKEDEDLPETALNFKALARKLSTEVREALRQEMQQKLQDEGSERELLFGEDYTPRFGCVLSDEEFYFVSRNKTFFDFTTDKQHMRTVVEEHGVLYARQEVFYATDTVDFVSFSDSEPTELTTPADSVPTET